MGLAVAATGLLVLAGWQFEIGFLKRPIPHLVAMNPVTALCFVLSGVCVVLLSAKKSSSELGLISSIIIRLSAIVLLMAGLLKLIDFIFVLGIKPDQLLFTEKIIEDTYEGISNRIAPTTALNFVLAGVSLWLISLENKKLNAAANYLALIIFVIGIFSVMGYFYRVAEFYGILAVLPMAVHTALCWMIVALSILFLNHNKGFMVAVTSANSGGRIARILLPAAVIVPVIFGYIRLWLNWQHEFSIELGAALLISSIILVFFIATLYSSVMLYKSDKAKHEIEEKLKKLNTDLEKNNERIFKLFNQSPVATSIASIQNGRFRYANDAFLKLFGLKHEDVIGKTSVELNINSSESREKMMKYASANDFRVSGAEINLRDSNGKMRDILASLEKIELEDGPYILNTLLDITERKEAEERIRESNERFFKIFNLSPVPTAITDAITGYRFVNDAFLDLFSFSRHEMIGKTSAQLDMISEEERNKLIDYIKQNGNNIRNLELKLKDSKGKLLDVLSSSESIELGGEQFLLSTIVNITELKKLEHELINAKAGLSHAQHLSKTGSWEYNLETHELHWSDELYSIFELEKMPSAQLLAAYRNKTHPEDLPELDKGIKEATENGTTITYHHRIIMNDGSIRHLLGLGEVIRNAAGKPIIQRGTAQDVTEQVLADEALKQTRDSLSAAQKIAHMGSWEWNIITNKEVWSDEQYRIFGYEPNEVAATYTLFQNALHPDDKAAVGIAVEQALAGIKPFAMEYRIIRKDGIVRYIEAKGEIERDREGKPLIMRGTVLDITERKETEEKLKHYYLALDAKNKEIEQFAFIASHDLQEPLRTINSFNELLANEYADKFDDNGRIYVKYISQSALRMRELITGLLDYSRLGSKRVLRKTDCNALLKDVVSNLHTAISESGAVIEAGTLPVIAAYELELSLLFQNLISNAIKFRKKEVVLHLKITAEQTNNEWKFAFADNGIGIREKHFEKIFVIFQRLHSHESYEGTGIGLSHCKKIVELHGGKIWIESTVGIGSTFYFTMPAQLN